MCRCGETSAGNDGVQGKENRELSKEWTPLGGDQIERVPPSSLIGRQASRLRVSLSSLRSLMLLHFLSSCRTERGQFMKGLECSAKDLIVHSDKMYLLV